MLCQPCFLGPDSLPSEVAWMWFLFLSSRRPPTLVVSSSCRKKLLLNALKELVTVCHLDDSSSSSSSTDVTAPAHLQPLQGSGGEARPAPRGPFAERLSLEKQPFSQLSCSVLQKAPSHPDLRPACAVEPIPLRFSPQPSPALVLPPTCCPQQRVPQGPPVLALL